MSNGDNEIEKLTKYHKISNVARVSPKVTTFIMYYQCWTLYTIPKLQWKKRIIGEKQNTGHLRPVKKGPQGGVQKPHEASTQKTLPKSFTEQGHTKEVLPIPLPARTEHFPKRLSTKAKSFVLGVPT